MSRLCVNIDHVATLRQARQASEPDPVQAAVIAELAGADGITIHVREDRRHMQERDLKILRQTVKTQLNLEMAPTDDMVRVATQYLPDMCTLVPENRDEVSTESGLDVAGNAEHVKDVTSRLHDVEIAVSAFIDPDPAQIKASARAGVDYIEINTRSYSEAPGLSEQNSQFERIMKAVDTASRMSLYVNAGHGLDYRNVSPIAEIDAIEELNIGHSIIARAVLVGLDEAVREMLVLVKGGSK